MAKNALGTLWPSGTLSLREPRLSKSAQADVPKIPKPKAFKSPKAKTVGLPKLGSTRFKRFGAL